MQLPHAPRPRFDGDITVRDGRSASPGGCALYRSRTARFDNEQITSPTCARLPPGRPSEPSGSLCASCRSANEAQIEARRFTIPIRRQELIVDATSIWRTTRPPVVKGVVNVKSGVAVLSGGERRDRPRKAITTGAEGDTVHPPLLPLGQPHSASDSHVEDSHPPTQTIVLFGT